MGRELGLNRISRRFLSLGALAGIYLVVGLVLRLALWFHFGRAAGVGASALVWIVPAGLVNDAIQALYLLLPIALYTLLLPDRWYRSTVNRVVLIAGSYAAILLFVYLAAVEHYFFAEFDARFNLVATDYLIYPKEVFNDIWEAYPVLRVFGISALIALVPLWLLRRPLLGGTDITARLRDRWRPFVPYVALLLIAGLAFRSETLARSDNRIANQLAMNGHSQFFQALRTNEIEYRVYYRSADPAASLSRLTAQLGPGGGTFMALARGRLDRQFAAKPDGLGALNVVVVMEESFGAEVSKLLRGDRDLMPSFDRYAQQGLWFTNMYAQGTRTVRGLEAITASFPPIPTVSIVRRPNNENIATWGSVMRAAGYSSGFLYGGFGYFDNMNAFFRGNGYDVLDRNDIPHPRFANIWGVSDEDLFEAALADFDRRASSGKPFFAQIMTTSNHKPFTFPKGLPGIPAAGGGRDAGVRYADYALGRFFEAARQHRWFDRTVFVVVADHGARVYGRAQIPLKTYEIPCLVWAPKHIKPQRVDVLASQIDIAPTVLGLLGLGYRAPFFGQDLLGEMTGPRVALFNHNHDVALYQDGKLVVLGMQRQVTTWAYDKSLDSFAPAVRVPDLEALAIGYFQTASDLYQAHHYE